MHEGHFGAALTEFEMEEPQGRTRGIQEFSSRTEKKSLLFVRKDLHVKISSTSNQQGVLQNLGLNQNNKRNDTNFPKDNKGTPKTINSGA